MKHRKKLDHHDGGDDMSHERKMIVIETKTAHIEKEIVEIKDNLKEYRNETNQRIDYQAGRIDRLAEKMDHHFKWLLSIIITSWFTTFGAILTILLKN